MDIETKKYAGVNDYWKSERSGLLNLIATVGLQSVVIATWMAASYHALQSKESPADSPASTPVQQLKSAIALMLRGARCLGDGERYDSFIESLRLIEQQADI